MPHDHPRDHDAHMPVESAADGGEYRLVEQAMRTLLIEKGVLTADDIRRQIEMMEQRSPAFGAKLVARAWTDAGFRARLLDDAGAAARDLGLDPDGMPLVQVLENTADVHHVVVCTLCSCYPRAILGAPPDWYKSRDYRARVVREPRAVLREFGTDLADGVTLRVVDSTADLRYLVLPLRPAGTGDWAEDDLAAIVTRDCMIGVAVPDPGDRRPGAGRAAMP